MIDTPVHREKSGSGMDRDMCIGICQVVVWKYKPSTTP